MTKDKYFIIPIICLLILVGCAYYWVVNFSPKIETPEDILLRKVNSLNTKIDSIKRANDSIKIIIDTTQIQIEHTYEKYIEVRDRIVYQSVDSDCIFFTNYLSEDSKRYIDTIHFEPVEAY